MEATADEAFSPTKIAQNGIPVRSVSILNYNRELRHGDYNSDRCLEPVPLDESPGFADTLTSDFAAG